MALKYLSHHIISLAAPDTASNSASVDDVVTVFYLVARQSTGPPYSEKRNPSLLRLVSLSSAKEASDEHRKIRLSTGNEPLYIMARNLVSYR